MARKILFLEIFSNNLIKYRYNSKYIMEQNGKLINKTNEKRYVISEEFVAKNEKVYLNECILKNVQIILSNEKNEKVLLNKQRYLYMNGKYKITIQLEPNVQFELSKVNKFFTLWEEKSCDYSRDLFTQRTNELQMLNSATISRKIEELLNFFKKSKRSILYIGDEFTYFNLKGQFDVVNIAFSDLDILEYILEHHRRDISIDFAFVESLWLGTGNSFFFGSELKRIDAILMFINLCKKSDVKTVFYNKEDPVFFEDFLIIASLVDYVITIDQELVETYKVNGVENVVYFPFFVDHKVFNPFSQEELTKKAFFAGAYYSSYKERVAFMERNFPLLAKDFGLEIIDRNKYVLTSNNKYPKKYEEYIKSGGLGIEELIEYSKNFLYAINLNSVVKSESMVARRVIEQLALGKIIVSNYSKAIRNLGYEGIIFDEKDDYLSIKKQMIEASDKKKDLIERGLAVLRKQSVIIFQNFVYELIGNCEKKQYIYILIRIESIKEYLLIEDQLRDQTYKELIILIESEGTDLEENIRSLEKKPSFQIEILKSDPPKYKDIPILIYNGEIKYRRDIISDYLICMDSLKNSFSKISFSALEKDLIFTEYIDSSTKIYLNYFEYISEKHNSITINFEQVQSNIE